MSARLEEKRISEGHVDNESSVISAKQPVLSMLY